MGDSAPPCPPHAITEAEKDALPRPPVHETADQLERYKKATYSTFNRGVVNAREAGPPPSARAPAGTIHSTSSSTTDRRDAQSVPSSKPAISVDESSQSAVMTAPALSHWVVVVVALRVYSHVDACRSPSNSYPPTPQFEILLYSPTLSRCCPLFQSRTPATPLNSTSPSHSNVTLSNPTPGSVNRQALKNKINATRETLMRKFQTNGSFSPDSSSGPSRYVEASSITYIHCP